MSATSLKKTQTLGFKLSMLILIFLLVVLGSCGVLTYFNQMSGYREQCKTNLREVGEYLENLIAADGEDFVRYQTYFLEHYDEVNVPVGADEYVSYRENYERLFHAQYPGKTLGADIAFDDLGDEVKRAYLIYRQIYWLLTFEQARASFDLSYDYYILPDSETESDIYIIDGTYPSRADHIALMNENPYYAKFDHPQGEEAEYLYLGDQVSNERDEYAVKWAVWDSGKNQTDFQVWNNEFGQTYAYYMPVMIGGQKMGLIGTEIDIERVNTAILHNTLRQFSFMGLVLIGALALMMMFINGHFVKRITALEAKVMAFSKTKDSDVAGEIRNSIRGRDEVSSLSEEVAQMIEEIRNYVSNIIMIHQELDLAHANVAQMSELALKDGLTGIRNRTAYKQETKKLEETLERDGTEFAIVMIDMNDLKKFNDVYGHEQGNAAIIKLCHIACDIFKHSMMFRIGGDEFVAILLHEDYANRERLIQELKDALNTLQQDETLQPWEKPNAAIGLATYDREKDTRVEDVFRRADERMYQNKKKMKPKGACR